MSDINDELRAAAETARREIKGLENIISNTESVLHDIHEPGRDGPDDPGASPFWKSESSAYCIVLRTLTAWPDAVIPYPLNAWVKPTVTPEQTPEGLRIRMTWYELVKCES